MKIVAAAVLLALTTLATPAAAHDLNGTDVSFVGAIPCAIACASWVDNGFLPCEAPFPQGSYVDHVTHAAPSAPGKVTVLEGTIDPVIDWDEYFCANDETRREMGQGANILGDPCSFMIGDILIGGCHEDMSTPVAPGQTVIFRAYNWSDALPAPGEYSFTLI